MANPRLCSISDCGKPVLCREYCSRHYSRFRLYGDPLGGSYFRQKQSSVCSVEGCDRKPKAHQLCELHYGRIQKRGTTDDPQPKETKSCSVEGCDHHHVAKGYCGHHYRQWKAYGNPLEERRPRKWAVGEPLQWLLDHVDHDGQGCLFWPFSRTGNGQPQMTNGEGRTISASRYMCSLVNGEPEDESMFAAHDCGKGHEACIHPKHLYWATPQQNTIDRYRHGTMLFGQSSPLSKLTEHDVRKIRSLKGEKPQRKLAAEYGVSKSLIGAIQRGEIWRLC